jgi:DNA-binding transcriptional ArsR family regulator
LATSFVGKKMFLASDARRTRGNDPESSGNGKSIAVVRPHMQAKPEFRDRSDPEVAVLDALVERSEEGMTVLEVRAVVDEDIDTIEQALSALQDDDLIEVSSEQTRTRIHPADRTVPDPETVPDEELGLIDALRERFGL